MIKVIIFYPNGPDTKFDMAYYTGRHLPLVQKKCGAACKGVAAERGLSGAEPGSKPTYAAIGYLTFDSVDSFQNSFGPHAGEIVADVPNYTNSKPLVQIVEVVG